MSVRELRLDSLARLGRIDWAAVITFFSLAICLPYRHASTWGLMTVALYALACCPDLRRLWARTLGLPLLAALAYLLWVASYSPNRHDALEDVLALAKALLVSVPLVYLTALAPERLRLALRLAVAGLAVLIAHLCYLQYATAGLSAITGLVGFYLDMHRNELAPVFALAMIYAYVLSWSEQDRRWTALWLLALLAFTAVAYANNSRGALSGMLAALPAALLRHRWRQAVLVALVVVALVVGASRLDSGREAMSHEGTIINGRNFIWDAYLGQIRERPLLGHGIRAHVDNPVLRARIPEPWPTLPHNIYLSLVYETGLVSLGFWLLWGAWVMVRAWRFLPPGHGLLWALGGALPAYMLVHGLVDFTFYSYGVLVPLLTGLVLFCLPARPHPQPLRASSP